MKLRGLTIAVIVLAVLVGALYWSQHRKAAEESAGIRPNAAPVMVKIDPATVTQLVIKQKEAKPVTLKKTAGKWQITQPKLYKADQDAVARLLSVLSALNTDRLVGEKAADARQYGLDDPAVEVDITGKGPTTQRLLLGDDTPAGADAYAALATDPRVFTIVSYNKTSLNKSLNDLRDKSLLTIDPDKINRVELLRNGGDIVVDRTKDGWQMVKPMSLPADSSAVNALIRALINARMDLSATTDAAPEFAAGTAVGTARVTSDGGVQTLEVRKSKDIFYAKSSAVDGAYKVDSAIGEALDKKPEDFRAKKKI